MQFFGAAAAQIALPASPDRPASSAGPALRSWAPSQPCRSEVLQVLAALDHAIAHGHLGFADPLTRIVVALVWLVLALWVAYLTLQVALLGLVELEESLPVSPLSVCVHIHFDNSVVKSFVDVRLLRARAAMEDKEVRLLLGQLRSRELLEGVQQVGLQLHIAGLVDAVHVAKGGGDRELLGDWREALIDGPDILRCRIQLVFGNTTVVNSIFNTTSDSNLHLKDQVHWRHLFEIFDTNSNVLLMRFL
mmetsp:Transcript_22783/g.41551  ORF Transcript_22783/g.41551 Transcript_22783/m.41551 type:complete len:248 (-) Transcript_22783:524-1267(-)